MKRGHRAEKTERLLVAAYEELAHIQPASVRAVCYRLFVAGHIDDMSPRSTRKVGRVLVQARERGDVPWSWIVDETREPERINTWDSPAHIIDTMVRQYRRDYWRDQPNRIEVWSEKGTVRGTLAPVLEEYGVTFQVMHGYGSATAMHNTAVDSMAGDKLLEILYCGDWDPSGMHMSEVDLADRVYRYGGVVEITRIALHGGDVMFEKLPSFPLDTKRKDPRHAWFAGRYGSRCWELDALPPPDLRRRVEDAIVQRLDMDAWTRAIEVEAAERESVHAFAQAWKEAAAR